MKSKSIPQLASLLTFAVALTASPFAFAADQPAGALAPIQELEDIRPGAPAFGAWNEPTEIASAADAEKHFEGEALESLNENVDFETQTVLIFAWRGSGQDKLTYVVAESFPEQISFSRQPGRTRDLRPHVKVFALRKNVKWATR